MNRGKEGAASSCELREVIGRKRLPYYSTMKLLPCSADGNVLNGENDLQELSTK